MKSAVIIDTLVIEQDLKEQVDTLFITDQLNHKSNQIIQTKLGQHLENLWKCSMKAVCLYRLNPSCNIDFSDVLQQIHKFLSSENDIAFKSFIQLDYLVLSFVQMMFQSNTYFDWQEICSQLEEALDLMENLDDLPCRQHDLSLIQQISTMLFIKPMQVLQQKQVPQNIAQILNRTFPNLPVLIYKETPHLVQIRTKEVSTQTIQFQQQIEVIPKQQFSDFMNSQELVSQISIKTQQTVQSKKPKLQIPRQSSNCFFKKKRQVKVGSGVMSDFLRRRHVIQEQEKKPVKKNEVIICTPDQMLFGQHK